MGTVGVDQALDALRAGRPVILPTDTVYGLCASPYGERPVRRAYALKGREPAQPSALLASDVDMLLECLPELRSRLGPVQRKLLPGPYTLVVPNPARRFRWLAGTNPDAIGKMLTYTGRTRVCMLSKCIHIGWTGFTKCPCARVSATSRWLNSSCTRGAGTGIHASNTTRTNIGSRPTTTIASVFRRANVAKRCSSRRSILLIPVPRVLRARAGGRSERLEVGHRRLKATGFAGSLQLRYRVTRSPTKV